MKTTRRPRPRRGLLALTLALGSSAGLVAATGDSAGAVPAASGGGAWTVYHHDPLGTGVAGGTTSLAGAHHAWTSPALQGQLYGEPLVSGSYVFVATTADVVYALHATTGTVAWKTSVGTPVPSTELPCGDIAPTVGIIGTPVIDPARHEIFAVADLNVHGAPAHYLVGLDTASGRVELRQDVDPPGTTPKAQLQRTGLNLTGGRVVFGFGGNSGDCSTYNGWVQSVPEAGGAVDRFEVDQGASQGAVWMGGAAPEVDASGDVWVASGNGSTTSGQPLHGDSVIKLSPTMHLLQSFTPSTWKTDNRDDLDLGSTAPVLLPDGHAIQVGKSQTAYLLDRAKLGGLGAQQATVSPVCGNDFDGGSAHVGSTAYLPCTNGTIAMRVTGPATLTVEWTTSISNAGPPIVAGGDVWVMDQSGHLDGLDPSTGTMRQQLSVGATDNHFSTPSVGDGLLLAPAASSVVAFEG